MTDSVFFGYDEQVLVVVNEEGGAPVPELVRRIELRPANENQPNAVLNVLRRMHADGIPPGDLLADSGYSHKVDWIVQVRALGHSPVVDLHPNDRGLSGTYHGALIIEGELYCPSTPRELWEIPPLPRGASPADIAEHDRLLALREKYKVAPEGRPDAEGFYRAGCPAYRGKVRCPLKPESISLPFTKPTILEPPDASPKVCRQATITVEPEVGKKVRQKHSYGSPMFRESYKRRTAAERAFASAKDSAGEDLTRGRIRVMGRAKIMLLRVCAWVARNRRTLLAFERRVTVVSVSLPRKTRKRRRGSSLQSLADGQRSP